MVYVYGDHNGILLVTSSYSDPYSRVCGSKFQASILNLHRPEVRKCVAQVEGLGAWDSETLNPKTPKP